MGQGNGGKGYGKYLDPLLSWSSPVKTVRSLSASRAHWKYPGARSTTHNRARLNYGAPKQAGLAYFSPWDRQDVPASLRDAATADVTVMF